MRVALFKDHPLAHQVQLPRHFQFLGNFSKQITGEKNQTGNMRPHEFDESYDDM